MGSLRSKFTLCLIGRSGSGKGVQAQLLLRGPKRRIHHMETGRFLRTLILKKKNPTSRIAGAYMKRGSLLPSWLAAYTWLKELVEYGHADKHLLYDGAPRRVWEARLIDEVLAWHGRPKALCIYIDVSEKVAMERLFGRGRRDDNTRAIKNRMNFFFKDVLPTIRYYQGERRLIRIDGDQSPREVSRSIERALSKRLGRNWRVKT